MIYVLLCLLTIALWVVVGGLYAFKQLTDIFSTGSRQIRWWEIILIAPAAIVVWIAEKVMRKEHNADL